VVRRVLVALLALGPVAVVLDRLGAAGKLTLFPLAALALIPLAWLIGEATEQAANYTGAAIGGFLNASFGNAPELIIALVALSDGLTDVVRASLTGSVVGNLLLVLGFVLLVGERGMVDRTSGFVSLATVVSRRSCFSSRQCRGSMATPTGILLRSSPFRLRSCCSW
jgi:Ca2+:H+ antiporter